jgi:hypothetical protein
VTDKKIDELYQKILKSGKASQTKGRTHFQRIRAEARSTRTGKYVKLNPCEICGKSAGAGQRHRVEV